MEFFADSFHAFEVDLDCAIELSDAELVSHNSWSFAGTGYLRHEGCFPVASSSLDCEVHSDLAPVALAAFLCGVCAGLGTRWWS